MTGNEPFEGDFYLRIEFEKLIKKFKIKNIVETGTFMGNTTKESSKMVENVYTIESIKKLYLLSKKTSCTVQMLEFFLEILL